MLAWRKPTVVRRALPTPTASTTPSAGVTITEVQIVIVIVGVVDRSGGDV
jgi:hypothetical protein